MLNFRKLKHDFPSAILKEGRTLFEKEMVLAGKIVKFSPQVLRLHCQVLGSFENTYSCEIEIDSRESEIIDSDCDCPYKYDCQHLAAVLFYLEENLDRIIVEYMQENEVHKSPHVDESEKACLMKAAKEAQQKETLKRGKRYQQELLHEQLIAARFLSQSPFFQKQEKPAHDRAQLAVIFSAETLQLPYKVTNRIEFSLALRLPSRSKPLTIPNIREFFNAVQYSEPLYIGTRRFFFTLDSFDEASSCLLMMIMEKAALADPNKEERQQRFALIENEAMGRLLSLVHKKSIGSLAPLTNNELIQPLPGLYCGSQEEPLCAAIAPAKLSFAIEYLEVPAAKLLLKPSIALDEEKTISLDDAILFDCSVPGLFYNNTYWCFPPQITRKHLLHLAAVRTMTIPEPLFGTFVENALPELMQFVEVTNMEAIDHFVTLPFTGNLQAKCEIQYLNDELEAALTFLYDKIEVPAAHSKVSLDHVLPFITPHGILARNLLQEQAIIDDLFQGFIPNSSGNFIAKTEKKIVEFMTEVIPRNQHRVQFQCPDNLTGHFIYDNTTFKLNLKESSRVDCYEVDLKVSGYLAEITLDQLWDCITSRRSYIELTPKKSGVKKRSPLGQRAEMPHKILVLDLEKLIPVVQLFDELGVATLSNHKELRPLWSLASIDPERFKELPITFSMSSALLKIQEEMMSIQDLKEIKMPKQLCATLRPYQEQGIAWLERLRKMHLNGILADDMGLGKTLQATAAIVQDKISNPEATSLIVCPTSLLYNWKEEIAKFAPHLKTLVVDGTPQQRRKLLNDMKKYDALITSYTLLQKDVEIYQQFPFSYTILDEAHQIKNRDTRNAKSVKLIQASHRLVLTGTPIENSLEDLWSLFDFLMPGLLSTYDRFVEKYIRTPEQKGQNELNSLRRKVAPFIMRRMKRDVLQDLPPVSEIVYHCYLSETQRALYQSYVTTAREELTQLVKKEGFERVQIHVLATLTRLKQICCHPAIFAKEHAERGDSAKYEMLLELVQSLLEGKHKAVIFSQYTRMLGIMREDFQRMGIPFAYLDGSTSNRLEIVNNFNNDPNIPIFLVSLKAGGTGLNLVGADTVIHYDMWWNPAVENQATDRVHRLGQKNNVSSYKIVTLNTIEEKIVEIHKKKKQRVDKVINCDDDAVSKLTWEEVLELLEVNFDAEALSEARGPSLVTV